MSKQGKENWKEVKWILRYLRRTSNHALVYGGSEVKLQGYVVVNFAGDVDSRRSTTGYVFALGSGAVS